MTEWRSFVFPISEDLPKKINEIEEEGYEIFQFLRDTPMAGGPKVMQVIARKVDEHLKTVMIEAEIFKAIKNNAKVMLKNVYDDSCSEGPAKGKNVLEAYGFLGIFHDEEIELWEKRFDVCAEGGVHDDGRSWCAYCGDVGDDDG